MPSGIVLNDELVEEARKIGRHKTKKSAVTAALREYVKYRKQLAVLDLAGKIDFDPDYDYKAQRGRQR
jgi:Arc/MetJ family transcription regulator